MTVPAGRLRSRFGWEQHCCLPLEAGCDIGRFGYLDVGVSYMSVNVGYAPHDIDSTMRVLSSWRRQVLARPEEFVLAATTADLLAARDSCGSGRF